jgi:hypothetical protein
MAYPGRVMPSFFIRDSSVVGREAEPGGSCLARCDPVAQLEGGPSAHDDRALDDVGELPDLARPSIERHVDGEHS